MRRQHGSTTAQSRPAEAAEPPAALLAADVTWPSALPLPCGKASSAFVSKLSSNNSCKVARRGSGIAFDDDWGVPGSGVRRSRSARAESSATSFSLSAWRGFEAGPAPTSETVIAPISPRPSPVIRSPFPKPDDKRTDNKMMCVARDAPMAGSRYLAISFRRFRPRRSVFNCGLAQILGCQCAYLC